MADDNGSARCLVLTESRVSESPYGIHLLAERGHELAQPGSGGGPLRRKLRDVLDHRSGMALDQTLRGASQARRSDIVLAVFERHALAAASWRRRGLPPYAGRPLAMIACWLAEDLRRARPAERGDLVRRFRGVDLTMVLSENQIDILVDAGFPRSMVERIPFGISPDLHPTVAASSRTRPVAAIGFDRGRDYTTLIEAVRGTGIEVDLFCRAENIKGLPLPSEVRFRGTVPYAQYRDVLAKAQVVAVPTDDMAYPSGQTVALEASATGACVVLSDTPALREYFTDETTLLCPPGDPGAWQSALRSALADPAARAARGRAAASLVRSRFTDRHLWAAVDAQFRRRGWGPRGT